jgi:hypothetical protein
VLADDAVQRFHALALPRLCEHRLARLFAFEIDGCIAGVYYGLHFAGRAYAYLGSKRPARSSRQVVSGSKT